MGSLALSTGCLFKVKSTNPDQWILLDRFSYSLSYVAVACSCMSFNPETRRISVGLENGTVSVC